MNTEHMEADLEYTDKYMRLLIAEAKELLRNATYQDGIAQCLTQDCEALESIIAQIEDWDVIAA